MFASKRLLWGVLIAALVGVQGVAIWYFLARSAPEIPSPHMAATRHRGDSKRPFRVLSRRDLEAGVPVQRERIDDFIDKVSQCDFQQCSAYLHEMTSPGEDVVFDVGIQTQDLVPSMRFAQTLADRRVAKLYSLLQAMPPGEAASRAKGLFDEKLDTHESDWRRAMQRHREGGDAPELNPKMIPIHRNIHALSAALFLCAAYCEPAVVLDGLDRWQASLGNLVNEINADPQIMAMGMQASMDALPEKLFLLNLYAFNLERQGCAQADRLAELTGQRIPTFTTVPFCAWDAHTNPFDFTHIHKGVPVDESKVLLNVSWAKSWGSVGMDEQRQQQILDAVRTLVEECAHKVEAK